MVHDVISSVPQLQTNQFKSQMTLVFSSNVLWLDSSLPENQTTTFPEHNRIQGFRTRTISTEKSKKGLLPGGNSYSRTQTLTHLEYSWPLLNPKGTFPTHQVSWMSKRSASGPRMAHPWGCWVSLSVQNGESLPWPLLSKPPPYTNMNHERCGNPGCGVGLDKGPFQSYK